MSNILRTCECGYADAPLSPALLRDKDCPVCGKRLTVENDEPQEEAWGPPDRQEEYPPAEPDFERDEYYGS